MPVDSVTWHAVGQIHKASSHLKHSVTPSSQREARRPQNESLWNKFSEHNLIFSTALHSSIYSLDPLMSLIPGGHNLEWYCQLGKCNGFHSRGFTDSFILFYFFSLLFSSLFFLHLLLLFIILFFPLRLSYARPGGWGRVIFKIQESYWVFGTFTELSETGTSYGQGFIPVWFQWEEVNNSKCELK